MLPSRKRCFTAADALLLLAAAFRILLQSTPASLSATCFARSGSGVRTAVEQKGNAVPFIRLRLDTVPNSLAQSVDMCRRGLAAWYMALASDEPDLADLQSLLLSSHWIVQGLNPPQYCMPIPANQADLQQKHTMGMLAPATLSMSSGVSIRVHNNPGGQSMKECLRLMLACHSVVRQ